MGVRAAGSWLWRRRLRAASVAAGVGAAVAAAVLLASWQGSSDPSRCAGAAYVPPAPKPARYGYLRLGPLALEFAARGSFERGVPYKVAVSGAPGSTETRRVTLRGWRCDDASPLSFAYGRNPFEPGRHYSAAEFRALGDEEARFRPSTPRMHRQLGYAGYMLFTAPGRWRLEVSLGENVLASRVVRIS